MTELNSEMGKLTKGIDKNNKELQSLPSLEKRVKEMAAEITGTLMSSWLLFPLFNNIIQIYRDKPLIWICSKKR